MRLPTSGTYSGPTVSTSNDPPNTPSIPSGLTSGQIGNSYQYSTVTTDPNSDNVYYWFDWGDGTNSGWIGPYPSGTSGTASKEWSDPGTYNVKAKAKDEHGAESSPLWSDSVSVCINGLWEDDPSNPCKKRKLTCTGEYEYQNKDDGTICGCTVSNTLKRCYGGVCTDTGICDSTCGADAACDGKKPGDSCEGGICDSNCKCVSVEAHGDGIVMFQNGYWAIKYGPVNAIPNFSGADKWLAYGSATGTPVVGDFNDDGTDDIAIYQNGYWAIKYGSVNAIPNFSGADKWLAYGGAGTPVVGDFNNDGTDDIAMYQNGYWAIKYGPVNLIPNFSGADNWLAYGGAGIPVVGDFNDDGTDDIAIYQNGYWAIKYGPVNLIPNFSGADKWLAYGGAGTPVVGDFNDDGTVDIAMYQNGYWAIKYGPVNLIPNFSGADKWLAYGGAGSPVVGKFN